MKKIIIDCHNHSKGSKTDENIRGSDGFDYVEDFAEKAREIKPAMCAITEHDVVNRKLKEILSDTEIVVPEAVEISAKNYDRDKSLHILYYAKTVSKNVDELLSDVLYNKKQMLKRQIDKLSNIGFKINIDDVTEFVKSKGHGEDGMNKWNITKYLFEGNNRDFNTKMFYSIFDKINLGDEDEYRWFYYNCMKSGGEFYKQFSVNTTPYEPSVKKIGELAQENNAIMSIAHPIFSFKEGIEYFKKELPDYIKKGVNAIEINAKTSEPWVEAIIEMKNKYNLILTFGSDCHAIGLDDDKHATFGTMNPYLELDENKHLIKENLEKFRERIGI